MKSHRRTPVPYLLLAVVGLLLLQVVAVAPPVAAAGPGAFDKSLPVPDATGQPLNVSLQWGTSALAARYEYCIDTSNDNACSGGWVNNGTSKTVQPPGLAPNTDYYWHVRAVNDAGTTYSNSNAWWHFKTVAVPPGAFNKSDPPPDAMNRGSLTQQGTLRVQLQWDISEGAEGYDYCVDTSDDDACSGGWAHTTVFLTILVLAPNTDYYWHVRAVNSSGITYSDGSSTAWWHFRTSEVPRPFTKSLPLPDATAVPLDTSLVWGSSWGADMYEYCIDTVDDDFCNLGWVNAGESTSVQPPGLAPNTDYYWQVYSYNYGTRHIVYANGSLTAFGHFRTGAATAPPSTFNKTSPPADATGQPLNVFLVWTPSAGADKFEYCVDTSNDNACSGGWVNNGTSKTVQPPGLAPNTDYYWHVRAVNGGGTTYSDGGSSAWRHFRTSSSQVTPVTVTRRSVAVYDGWVRESGETSNVGGTLDSTAATCRVGDDAADRQYRAILDFNTRGLPDNAVITGAFLRIKRSSFAGSNPFLTHGDLTVDIGRGGFNGVLALENSDFQAAAGQMAVGDFAVLTARWYRADLNTAAFSIINPTGHTQFRLRFASGDNDDAGADYLSFHCGDADLRRNRPRLVITYHLP